MDAFYLPTRHGWRFCVLHRAAASDRARGAVLYIHPFGEEMHKARRMAALQARALAQAGYDVLQIDLHGCGDSAGDFGDATWETWQEDVRIAHAWLARQTAAPLWLWGLRTGCLLASAVAHTAGAPARLLLWQPVSSGRRFLQQFLRMRRARAVFGNGDSEASRDTTAATHEASTGHDVIEVGGYRLGAALADGLAGAELAAPPADSEVHWFEVLPPEGVISADALGRLETWQAQGCRTAATAVAGMPFWQTQEINECPALIASTLRAMPQ